MVDTWATVGSCAQIGKNVHLSGGVGIGGVLEPLQANPVIIEDNCFIGRAFGSGGRRDRGREFSHLHGRVSRPEHQDLRPRNGFGHVWPHSGGLGGGRGQPAFEGRFAQPVLRGDREEGGRENARQSRR